MTKPVRQELRSLLMETSGLGFQKPSHNRPSSHLIQNVQSDRSQRFDPTVLTENAHV
jgi:hypothetical protein